MAKVRIKSEKLTSLGGIFAIMEQFHALLSQTIDSTLGLLCSNHPKSAVLLITQKHANFA